MNLFCGDSELLLSKDDVTQDQHLCYERVFESDMRPSLVVYEV
jgi:hypothetical protein